MQSVSGSMGARSFVAVLTALMGACLLSACGGESRSDSATNDATPIAQVQASVVQAQPGSCVTPDDCVSGVCQFGKCAICGSLTFERDTRQSAVARGQVVENLYSPVAIRTYMDALRTKRGLGVAYASSADVRLAQQGNLLISQASFTDADVLNGFVASPAPQSGPSAFDITFPDPVCADSFTFVGLDSIKAANVDLFGTNGALLTHRFILDDGTRHNAALGFVCGVSRLSIAPLGKAALDDVRVCSLGKSPPVPSSEPGQSCGVDVVEDSSTVLDPCVSGVTLATKRIRTVDLAGTVSFSVTADSTVCVRLSGDTRRVRRISMNGEDIPTNDDHVSPLEVRHAVATGAQSVTVNTLLGLTDLTLEVLGSPGTLDPRIPVRSRGLLVTNTNETPKVLTPGQSVVLSAAARVGNIAPLSPLKLFYDFRIYDPTGCRRVVTLSGNSNVTAGVVSTVSATWDGKDANGQTLPDGDYLWDVHVAAVPILDLDDRVDVTTPFHHVRIFGQVPTDQCRQQVRDAIAAAGVPNPNDRFDVTRDLLRCGADVASSCDVDFFTVLALQRRREGERLMADQILPAQYVQFQQERTHKVALSDADPSWTTDFCRGDGDRDLVPDNHDLCPNTPPLTPTDDHGCTDTTVPVGPSRDDVQDLFKRMRVGFAPACPIGGRPTLSEVFSACETADHALRIVVQPERSMPADCPVWYVVRGTLRNLSVPLPGQPPRPGEPMRAYTEFALGPPMSGTLVNDGIQFEITVDQLHTDIVPPGYQIFDWIDMSAAVQTLNGAGERSEIGPQKHFSLKACH